MYFTWQKPTTEKKMYTTTIFFLPVNVLFSSRIFARKNSNGIWWAANFFLLLYFVRFSSIYISTYFDMALREKVTRDGMCVCAVVGYKNICAEGFYGETSKTRRYIHHAFSEAFSVTFLKKNQGSAQSHCTLWFS